MTRAPAVPAVDIYHLSFRYPDGTPALDDICLTIQPGESVALLGPNGAGKTTLALHLNGLLRGQGRVAVLGLQTVPANLGALRQRVGLVFQDPDDQLFMNTLGDDVAFGPRNMGLEPEEVERRVAESLELLGLDRLRNRPPHRLSYGQKRRATLAGVLAMKPDLLVLDEPSGNLDPVGRRRLAELLAQLDCTLLVVTHDLPYALQTCRRAVILNGGRAVADGPTTRILADRHLLEANGLEWPFGFTPPAPPG